MIRHTRWELARAAALAIGTLPVAVIETPFRTLLVTAIGAPTLFDSRLFAAAYAAVALSAITVRAEIEHGVAFAADANP